ncbi:hypothetical protein [Aliiglaciecola aliphaticivorans]
MKKFVIITSARSGSNLLIDLLNTSNEVYCHGEIFHPSESNGLRVRSLFENLLRIDPKSFRDERPFDFLESVYHLGPSDRAVGFKMFYGHFPMVLDWLLLNEDYKIIHLFRNDLLSSFLSVKVGEKSNVWHQGFIKDKKEAPKQDIQVDFDENQFSNHANYVRNGYNKVENSLRESKRILSIEYGDILTRSEDIQGFLEIENIDPKKISIKKQNSRSLLEGFANKEKVEKFISTNSYLLIE